MDQVWFRHGTEFSSPPLGRVDQIERYFFPKGLWEDGKRISPLVAFRGYRVLHLGPYKRLLTPDCRLVQGFDLEAATAAKDSTPKG